MVIGIRVNGKNYQTGASPDTPLLWVLRDNLQLKGTKYGCGMGLCGACTVLLDGRAIRSCQMALSAVGPGAVTTIENTSLPILAKLRNAWQAEDVPQCGYCQAGQLLSATALLSKTPRPSDPDIDAAMSGNLCRCGTYGRIRSAIHRAARGGA